jgi:hypothetical protein
MLLHHKRRSVGRQERRDVPRANLCGDHLDAAGVTTIERMAVDGQVA